MVSSSGGQVTRLRRVLRLHAAVVVEVVIAEAEVVVAVDGVLSLGRLKNQIGIEVEKKFLVLLSFETDGTSGPGGSPYIKASRNSLGCFV